MKKILVVILSVICLGIMFSCEKTGNDINEEQLEGKWWVPTRGEAYFNGTIVRSEQVPDFAGYSKLYFEKGTCTLIEYETGKQKNYPYTFSNKTLTIITGLIDFRLLKLTQTEAIVEMRIDEWKNYTSFSGKVVGQYKGIDIYESEKGDYHWYYDKNGNAVVCSMSDNGNWCDTIRAYFKAE